MTRFDPDAAPFWEAARGDGPLMRLQKSREKLAARVGAENRWYEATAKARKLQRSAEAMRHAAKRQGTNREKLYVDAEYFDAEAELARAEAEECEGVLGFCPEKRAKGEDE